MATSVDLRPTDLDALVQGSVGARAFESEDAVVRRALRTFFEDRPELRVAAATHLYEAEEISLGKAARLADRSRPEMAALPGEHGVQVDLGPAGFEDAEREIDVARNLE